MARPAKAMRIGLAAALLSAASVAGAAAQPATVADLPLPGSSERILFIAVPHPQATVILLSGGKGMIAIDNAGTIRPGENFLVRTRNEWAAQGFAVAVLGPPGGASLLGRRHSAPYRAALEAAVDYVRARAAAPVWVIGTSQGTIGAVNAGHLAPKVAGIVLTSSVTAPSRSGETVFDADPATVGVPALVVANRSDGCVASPPGNAPRLLAALSRAPRRELVVVDSSEMRSAPCRGDAPHGYYGIEGEVVRRIADWIKAAPRG